MSPNVPWEKWIWWFPSWLKTTATFQLKFNLITGCKSKTRAQVEFWETSLVSLCPLSSTHKTVWAAASLLHQMFVSDAFDHSCFDIRQSQNVQFLCLHITNMASSSNEHTLKLTSCGVDLCGVTSWFVNELLPVLPYWTTLCHQHQRS